MAELDPSRSVADNALEIAIGRQIRRFRNAQGMTQADLARQSGLSLGMLSKVENGMTSPSLASLQGLAEALGVPVTALFRLHEDSRQATFVAAGQGLNIERQGTRAGHHYQLLGHSSDQSPRVEPYLVTLSHESDVFPLFQHDGVEFIHLLTGKMLYRHANNTYLMSVGDSLYFDSAALHGPEELIELPVKMLALIVGRDGMEGKD